MLEQPRKGHRAGLEAVLIAAAAPLHPGETILDIGAGVGAAGLCALARVAGSHAILVEAEAPLATLARANSERTGLAGHIEVIACDIARPGAAARAKLTGQADHAIANPPFYDPRTNRIPAGKARAHAAPHDALDVWVRFAAAAVRPGGTLTLIHRAEALAAVLDAFSRRFGGAMVLPVHPRPGQPATRIIVQGRRGSRAPLCLLPGITLHGPDGHAFTPQIERVLREGASLPLVAGRD